MKYLFMIITNQTSINLSQDTHKMTPSCSYLSQKYLKPSTWKFVVAQYCIVIKIISWEVYIQYVYMKLQITIIYTVIDHSMMMCECWWWNSIYASSLKVSRHELRKQTNRHSKSIWLISFSYTRIPYIQ